MALRNWLRSKLLDHELGVLGGELERAETRLEQQQITFMAMRERFERLINRVTMRMARSGRDAGYRDGGDDDARILESLRGRGNGEYGDDPWR